MAWIYLIIAGLLEVVWAYSMKKSEGFTLLTPSLITLVTMAASFGLPPSAEIRNRLAPDAAALAFAAPR